MGGMGRSGLVRSDQLGYYVCVFIHGTGGGREIHVVEYMSIVITTRSQDFPVHYAIGYCDTMSHRAEASSRYSSVQRSQCRVEYSNRKCEEKAEIMQCPCSTCTLQSHFFRASRGSTSIHLYLSFGAMISISPVSKCR